MREPPRPPGQGKPSVSQPALRAGRFRPIRSGQVRPGQATARTRPTMTTPSDSGRPRPDAASQPASGRAGAVPRPSSAGPGHAGRVPSRRGSAGPGPWPDPGRAQPSSGLRSCQPCRSRPAPAVPGRVGAVPAHTPNAAVPVRPRLSAAEFGPAGSGRSRPDRPLLVSSVRFQPSSGRFRLAPTAPGRTRPSPSGTGRSLPARRSRPHPVGCGRTGSRPAVPAGPRRRDPTANRRDPTRT